MAIYLQFPLGLGRRFAGLDGTLIVPPPGWGALARWFPRSTGLYEAVAVVFVVAAVLGLIGLWTRFAVPVAVAAGLYVFTVPQLFGKIMVKLWQRSEGLPEIGSARIICEQYDMGLPGAPPVESTVLGEVTMVGGGQWR